MQFKILLFTLISISIVSYVCHAFITKRAYATPIVIGVMGLISGWACVSAYPGANNIAVFLCGYGAVHLPALATLILEHRWQNSAVLDRHGQNL